MVRAPGLDTYKVTLTTDARSRIVLGSGVRYSTGTGVGRGTSRWQLLPTASIKPNASSSISFGPTIAWGSTAQQFVTSVADPTAIAFAGRRAIFATIKQTTLSLDTRASWTFTPNLTLETFVQPFFASGSYSRFNEYARPRQSALVVYGRDAGSSIAADHDAHGAITDYKIDPDGAGGAPAFTLSNPNFDTRSLLGNAVLRWEYRPGSTLFLVWTHSREFDDGTGDFQLRRDWSALFRSQPTNTVQLKVSYWLGI